MNQIVQVAAILALLSVGACKSTSTAAPAQALAEPEPSSVLSVDDVALTVGRCVRVAGSSDCHSVVDHAPTEMSLASQFFISCLTEQSGGRVVYIGDFAPHAGLWLDIAEPSDAPPSTDGTPRREAIAALYRDQGKFVRGFQYNWGAGERSPTHVCESMIQDILAPEGIAR